MNNVNGSIIMIAFCFSAFMCTARERLGAETLYAEGCKAFAAADFQTAARLLTEFHTRYWNEPAMSNAIPRVIRLLGCAWYNLGDMPKAIEHFEQYLDCAPRDMQYAECLFLLADAYRSEGRFKDALSGYMKLLGKFPRWNRREEVRYQVAVCYLLEEKYEKAIPILCRLKQQAVIPLIKDASRTWLIKCLYETGQYDESLKALLQCIRSGGSRYHQAVLGSTAAALGDWYYSSFEYERALEAYRCITRRDEIIRQQKKIIETLNKKLRKYSVPGNRTVYMFHVQARGESLLAHVRKEQARIEEMNGFDSAWLMRLGRCLYDMGRLWEACIVFQEIIHDYPQADITETAQIQHIYCLTQLRLYDRAVNAIDDFIGTYPDNPALPVIAFLKAEVYINREMFSCAEKELQHVLDTYPDLRERDRVLFYLYLSQAMQQKFSESRTGLEEWLADPANTNSRVRADAEYWYAMVMFFSKDYSNALQRMQGFSTQYLASPYNADIAYRKGVIHYMQERYSRAAVALIEFIKRNPKHPLAGDARVLRGDALAAMGELNRALKAYSDIQPADGGNYHYAVAQRRKCLRMLKDYTNMVRLYTAYVAEIPDTPNVVEGIYWLGWSYRQLGDIESARRMYWRALKQYGTRRDWEGFQDIAGDMHRLYAGSNYMNQLAQRIREEREIAWKTGNVTLASRLDMIRFRHLTSQGKERLAAELVRNFITSYPTNMLGADGLAFAGRRLHEQDDHRAHAYFDILTEEFPGSVFTGEAYLRCAQYAGCRGDRDVQQKLLKKAEAEACDIRIAIEIKMEQAEYARMTGLYRQAAGQYESVLANRAARGMLWPKALLGIATSYQELGEYSKAIPYYQRLYVMYGAYTNLVVRAYANSGRCFEYLQDYAAAAKTYTELLGDGRLSHYHETDEARNRLQQLREEGNYGHPVTQ
jgi:tetratricopeptide (TPR) repeat protein